MVYIKNSQKNTLYQEYLLDYEKYIKIYGKNTLVFIQVGLFYESYATDKRGPNLLYLGNLLNIACIRRNKYIAQVDENNPYVIGFPKMRSQKYISILNNEKYTVILINREPELHKLFIPNNQSKNLSTKEEYKIGKKNNYDCQFCLNNVSTDIISLSCYHELCIDCANSIWSTNEITCPFCKNRKINIVYI